MAYIGWFTVAFRQSHNLVWCRIYIVLYSYLTSLVVQLSESMATNHEVPGSIPSYTVGIFPRGDHGLSRLVEFRFKGPPGTTSSCITTHIIGTTLLHLKDVPTSEVGYTPAMPRREDHQVHKDMWWHWTKKKEHSYLAATSEFACIASSFSNKRKSYIFLQQIIGTFTSKAKPDLRDV